jgi:hypothetical protein
MKKWIFILSIFCLLVIIGKVWGGGIWGFMRPPSFFTPTTYENYQVDDGASGWENYQVSDGGAGWENYQVVE